MWNFSKFMLTIWSLCAWLDPTIECIVSRVVFVCLVLITSLICTCSDSFTFVFLIKPWSICWKLCSLDNVLLPWKCLSFSIFFFLIPVGIWDRHHLDCAKLLKEKKKRRKKKGGRGVEIVRSIVAAFKTFHWLSSLLKCFVGVERESTICGDFHWSCHHVTSIVS